MKLLKFGFFLVALGLLGCAEDFDVFDPDDLPDPITELDGNVSNFFDAVRSEVPTETHTYYEDWGTQIVTDRETIIDVPWDAFVHLDGSPVTGVIDLEVVELRSAGEILLYGIPTESHGNLLQSGGEFHISANQNGAELRLAQGKQIQIRVVDSNPQERMELWYGVEVGTQTQSPVTGS